MGWLRTAGFFLLLAVAYQYLPSLFGPKLNPVVEGFFHPKFRKVADVFRQNFQTGKEEGGSFAVYHKGQLLFNMWGGYADVEALRPWREDTVSIAYSATKGVAAITVAKMVEKGWLDYKKPVAHYWPQFAQNGKEKITVEMLLSHQAGLASLGGRKISIVDFRDKNEEVVKLLEAQAPAWTPGTAVGYHGMTFGFYVDTLAQKADPKHRNISHIFQEEIAEPYGIDFHIGLPKELSYRVARGVFYSTARLMLASVTPSQLIGGILYMFVSNPLRDEAISVLEEKLTTDFYDPELQSIGMSSFVGFGTAKSLAKLYGNIASGGKGFEKQLLTPEVVKKLETPLTSGTDKVFQHKITLGPGVIFANNSKKQQIFGHPGYGGQIAFADVPNQLGFAYITNYDELLHLAHVSLRRWMSFRQLLKRSGDVFLRIAFSC